jgi:hypothetical protein
MTPLEQLIAAARKVVADQHNDDDDWLHPCCLGDVAAHARYLADLAALGAAVAAVDATASSWLVIKDPCTCGHSAATHHRGTGQCMAETPTSAWSCACHEYDVATSPATRPLQP